MPNLLYAKGGRLHGHYVYAIQCSDPQKFFIKIGVSVSPLKRLDQVRTSCPFIPEMIATMHMISREEAYAAEAIFHNLLKPMRVHGEWFAIDRADKTTFNEVTRSVVGIFARKSWPLKWVRMGVKPMIAAKESLRGMHRQKWRKNGQAYRDACKDGMKSLR